MGRTVRCPNCDGATGVPIQSDAEVTDMNEGSDGASPTICLECETQFDVHYVFLEEERGVATGNRRLDTPNGEAR